MSAYRGLEIELSSMLLHSQIEADGTDGQEIISCSAQYPQDYLQKFGQNSKQFGKFNDSAIWVKAQNCGRVEW